MRYDIVIRDISGGEAVIDTAYLEVTARMKYRRYIKLVNSGFDQCEGNEDVILRTEYGQDIEHYYN